YWLQMIVFQTLSFQTRSKRLSSHSYLIALQFPLKKKIIFSLIFLDFLLLISKPISVTPCFG
ncbi:hypothetical protein, partial [Acinetobacter johnsonii]|uniref:hypothetical protein n=1 Tax=Acinetobacter johnsonii TaxID=40214 RepID=UPI001C089D35